MPEGMRNFIPHKDYPHVSAVLFEQYGRPASEIAEGYFSADYDESGCYADGNNHPNDLSEYFYLEFCPLLIEQGYYRNATESDINASLAVSSHDPVPTDTHKLFEKALERKDVVHLLTYDIQTAGEHPKWEDSDEHKSSIKYSAELIKFIYAAAEYIGDLQEQRQSFEDSRREAVIVPPLFDESFFSPDR